MQNQSKIINAWAIYDWANSVYNLVITATIFPIYFKTVTEIRNETTGQVINNIIQLGDLRLKNTTLYDFALSFAYLLTAALSPILSGIADYGGSKKRFMMMFTYLGAIACGLMYFFDKNTVLLGVLLLVLACMGYSGSLVFYNAYLPEIATPNQHDRVSAKGYALGYIGSSILLIINLIMIMNPSLFGFTNSGQATRIAFLTVGLWWLGFAQIPFYYLPNNLTNRAFEKHLLIKGYQELRKVWISLKKYHYITKFLTAFFVYSMGVQTVMLVANHFGSQEIKYTDSAGVTHYGMESGQLITTILIIQFVAMGGAYLFSYVSRIKGNLFTLKAATLIWSFICIVTYFFVYTPFHFYMVAALVGLVMGGIQSLSRSTYSKLIPETEDHASYFSFYDVCEKLSIVLGMAVFGVINELSSSMREPIIALVIFFISGFLLLSRIPKTKLLAAVS
jgi:UMF1 family MFS transporter